MGGKCKKTRKKEARSKWISHRHIKDQKVKKNNKNYYKNLFINGRKMNLLNLQEMFYIEFKKINYKI